MRTSRTSTLFRRSSVSSISEGITGSEAAVTGSHELVEGVAELAMLADNAIGLAASGQTGESLAEVEGTPVVVLVEHGGEGGEVLALGDVGMLISQGGQPSNFRFWQNLAQYAASR